MQLSTWRCSALRWRWCPSLTAGSLCYSVHSKGESHLGWNIQAPCRLQRAIANVSPPLLDLFFSWMCLSVPNWINRLCWNLWNSYVWDLDRI
jgi:hypothetical protein